MTSETSETTASGDERAPRASELPVTSLPGIGPARAERLARLGIATVEDLCVLVPRALERQGGRLSAKDARDAVGREVSVRGSVCSPRLFRRGRRRSVLRIELEDESGRIGAMFFNQPWLYESLRTASEEGSEVELYGRVVETRQGPALSSPKVADEARPLPAPGSLLPVYALTDGIGQEYLRGLVRSVAGEHAESLEEPLDAELLEPHAIPLLGDAVRELHDPSSEAGFHAARRRVGLESLLAREARFVLARAERRTAQARPVTLDEEARLEIARALPHDPTGGQRAMMAEIERDLARTIPMRRLLQGDVGSGKTLVGLYAMALVATTGAQAALLVPTELLAEQHARRLVPWLEERGIGAALLTGSVRPKVRRSIELGLVSGETRVVIGTHALFSEGVDFRRLELVVIDEQQRFGVSQKRALLDKGRDVHALLMTATPIPRTLALSLHGDLDVSLLREKPGARGVVRTHVVPPEKAADMERFLGERMEAGERVFWVCPRIDPPDTEDDAGGDEERSRGAAEEAFARLAAGDLAEHGVELVHGRLPFDERARALERFHAGDSKLLVGTTILEVGIDVPEATVMVVEGAERLGLAQLHQLRGRVGRGSHPSWCLLLGGGGGLARLKILEESDDGFRIAEEDLKLRGMGNLAGDEQAGHELEGLVDPLVDLELVLLARSILDGRPELVEHYVRRGGPGQPASPALV